MPYKPNQITEEERSRFYNVMWINTAASLINLANAFLGFDSLFFALAWGFTLSGLYFAAFGDNSDEFMRGRLNIAMRFAVGVVLLYLLAAWLVNVADLAHSTGYALASGERATSDSQATLFWTDAQTFGAVIAAVFYAGYAFAVWNEGRGSDAQDV